MRVLQKVCQVCGAPFATRSKNAEREKFCSARCRRRFWNQRMWQKRRILVDRNRACAVCAKPFVAPVTRPKALTCSPSCNQKRQDERRKETRSWQPSSERRCCVQCGTAFSPKKYGRDRQKFCSVECRTHQNQLRYVARVGQTTLTNRSRNRKWHGQWRAAVDRDGGKCRVCQTSPREPHVHHIDGTGHTQTPNHSLENLVTLCSGCHLRLHRSLEYRVVGDELILNGMIFRLLGWGDSIRIPLEAIRPNMEAP